MRTQKLFKKSSSGLLLILVIILLGLPRKSFTQIKNISGVILDIRTKEPIPYVSIGIKNKPIGTISDTIGRFRLLQNYENISHQDSIIFSSIGYKTFGTTWGNFRNNYRKIFLTPDLHSLPAVNISAKSFKTKIYGRGPAHIELAPRGYKNMPQISDEKGREQASILKVDKDILLRALNVEILRRKEKNITLRMNIYDVKDGIPDKRLLTKNVIFSVKGPKKNGETNHQKIDLRPYHIHLNGFKEIALGIEILDRELGTGDTSRTAFYIPSYPSPVRSSFYRLKSQSPWEKVGSSYLIASLEANVLKKGDYIEEVPDNDTLAMQVMGKMFGAKMLYGNDINRGKRVNLGNASIYYETYGTGEPLLLLHGNNENINSFKEQIRPLSKYFKVIAVDSRGQGNSTNTYKGKYTYELFASDMKQLLDSLHLKKANILGWSDGGNTGLTMAIKYPDYVNKLAVMGANAFAGEEAIDTAVIKTFEGRSRKYSDKMDEESINQKKLADLVLNYPHLTEQELQTIQSSVLIIAGENDVIKEEHTLFIHENIQNSQVEIIKGTDHYAPLKDSKTFNKLIIDFFLKG